MADPYPLLYHAHHSRHMEDLPFWLELAAETGGPLLELGCGSGRLLLPLARAGYSMFGVDRDSGMLRLLRQQMDPDTSARVSIWQADFTRPGVAGQFPLVFLPCNTLTTLSGGQRADLFWEARRLVAPGGVFAASGPNPDFLRRLPATSDLEVEEIFPHPEDGEPVQVSSGWERGSESLVFLWRYDHLLPDGRVERVAAETRHAFLTPEALQVELTRAGYSITAFYGDFDRSPLRRASPYCIFLARPG